MQKVSEAAGLEVQGKAPQLGTPGGDEVGASGGVLAEVGEGDRQRRGVGRIEPGAGFAADFGQGGYLRREDGDAVMKGLEERNAKTLVQGRKDKCPGVLPKEVVALSWPKPSSVKGRHWRLVSW